MTNINQDEVDKRIAAAKASRAIAEEREQNKQNPPAGKSQSLLYNPIEESNPTAPAHVLRSVAGQVRPLNIPEVKDLSRMNVQQIHMADTSTEPGPENSVKVGSITVFHSDDGGPFISSREKVSVIDPDGKRIDSPQQALWTVYEELKRLAEAARTEKGQQS